MNRLSLQEVVALHSEMAQARDERAISLNGIGYSFLLLALTLLFAFLLAGSPDGKPVRIVDPDARLYQTPGTFP
jgi:hypothetical protein